jgi:hypothetical protein
LHAHSVLGGNRYPIAVDPACDFLACGRDAYNLIPLAATVEYINGDSGIGADDFNTLDLVGNVEDADSAYNFLRHRFPAPSVGSTVGSGVLVGSGALVGLAAVGSGALVGTSVGSVGCDVAVTTTMRVAIWVTTRVPSPGAWATG